MGLIELTTITLTMVGISIVIVKAINKNTAQTIEMKEQFLNFKMNCESEFGEVKDDVEELSGYIIDHDKRICRLEDWKLEVKND